jgi:membrane-bound lytic murein transglycosylase B
MHHIKSLHLTTGLLFALAVTGSIGLVSGIGAEPAKAQSATGFAEYLGQLRMDALAAGISTRVVDETLPTLEYLPDVVRLDRSQPGGTSNGPIPDFAPYKKQHVTQDRITLGRRKLAALRPVVNRIEAETGVPAAFLIAIYGKESSYGGYTGKVDVPSALATLAYEGRRRAFFTGEFIAALHMIERGVPRWKLRGSWAGAMGFPQFMPSTYDRMAKDGDGDGLADIWSNETDTMTSIANYFVESGWRRGEPWGFAVTVPTSLDRDSLKSRITAPRCPRVFERHSDWRSMAEWRAMGVAPKSGYWAANDHVMATLLEPDGTNATAYLLTSNYRVILDYNCSNFYALTVGLLADEIGK